MDNKDLREIADTFKLLDLKIRMLGETINGLCEIIGVKRPPQLDDSIKCDKNLSQLNDILKSSQGIK